MTRRGFVFTVGSLGAVAGAARKLQAAKAEVPRPAPEFVVRMANGQQVLLSSFKGKVIALEFLQTTCPACQAASGLLQKLYREFGAKGFQPVGVAFNDMAALLVPDYIKQLNLAFPVGFAPREEVLTYIQQPPTERFYVPILLFIDRDFTIRGQYMGGDEFFKNEEANMRATVEMLLKEPASKSRASRSKGKKSGQ